MPHTSQRLSFFTYLHISPNEFLGIEGVFLNKERRISLLLSHNRGSKSGSLDARWRRLVLRDNFHLAPFGILHGNTLYHYINEQGDSPVYLLFESIFIHKPKI
jgi:hypothetical protein